MFGADRLDTNFNFYLDDLEVISVPQETAYGVGGRMLKGVLTLSARIRAEILRSTTQLALTGLLQSK